MSKIKWTKSDQRSFDRAYDAWCKRRGIQRYNLGQRIRMDAVAAAERRKAGDK